jgi:hypothetical protein
MMEKVGARQGFVGSSSLEIGLVYFWLEQARDMSMVDYFPIRKIQGYH